MLFLPFIFIYLFIFGHTAQTCKILIPPPGVESMLPVIEGQILNHWTTRAVPLLKFFRCSAFQFCQVIFLTPQNQASFFVPNVCLHLICLTITSTYWFWQEFLKQNTSIPFNLQFKSPFQCKADLHPCLLWNTISLQPWTPQPFRLLNRILLSSVLIFETADFKQPK